MDDSGNVREDLKLPSGHDDADELARQIKSSWDEEQELVLTVLKSMNQEQVNAMKEGGYRNYSCRVGHHAFSPLPGASTNAQSYTISFCAAPK